MKYERFEQLIKSAKIVNKQEIYCHSLNSERVTCLFINRVHWQKHFEYLALFTYKIYKISVRYSYKMLKNKNILCSYSKYDSNCM